MTATELSNEAEILWTTILGMLLLHLEDSDVKGVSPEVSRLPVENSNHVLNLSPGYQRCQRTYPKRWLGHSSAGKVFALQTRGCKFNSPDPIPSSGEEKSGVGVRLGGRILGAHCSLPSPVGKLHVQ